MPNVLTYSGWSLVSNPDWLNVKYRTNNNPQKSWNYNIYYWDAGWTLKSWHSIVMKVVTVVNKMPTSKDDYKNIACVIKDNKELDCDDDQPNTSVWTLKVEKTLIWPKEINKVWDVVQWTLKVRAVEWDVKNPIIRDKMPDVLWFTWYTVVHNGWLAISQPYLSWNRVTWYTSWGYLASWDYIEIRVDTYAKVMPEKEEENVLCAWPEDRPEYEDKICDKKPVHAPDLRIIKSFADGSKTKTVKIGEDLGYRITFGNSGTAAAKITSIKDFLPKNVEYGTSAIYIIKWDRSYQLSWNEVIDTNKKVEWVYVDIYGGITLAPHSTWYILLTWKVLSWYQDNRTNFACIYLNDKKIDCDDATHNIDNNVSCKPALNPWTFWEVCSSDNSTFSTTVTCKSSSDADIEIICNGSVVKTGHASQLTWTCSASTNNTDHKVQCRINWKTTWENWEVCEASFRRNTKSCGGPSWCFPAWTKVTMADGTTKNIEDVNEWDEVLSYNTNMNVNEWNVVTQKFVHANHVHEMYELTINWKVLKVTDVHPFYVRKSESSKDYDWIEAKNLKAGDILLMSDGNLAKIEKINHYSNQETVYNLEVEGNHDYFVDEWYLVHNKPTPNPPDPDSIIYDPVNCFNINAWNASIQEWEILPFYWNVERLSTVAQEGNYVEYKVNNYPYGEKDNYSNILKSDCTDDEDGHIALNSMLCSFEVTDWKGNSVRTLNDQPCLNSKTSKVQPALLSWWADRSINKYAIWSNSFRSFDLNNDKNYAFRSNVYYIDEFKAKYGVYWEYKLSLKQIKYARCENNKWEGRWINPSEWVECQSNFVVTNPYTVQKTPSGNLKASIERLSKYLYMNWDEVFQMSDLLDAIEVTQAAYEPNEAVKTAMDNFIKKYSKLAVNAGNWLKKVPWKNIYFVDKDIKLLCDGETVKIDKPVTFVQTQWNTTICGDIDYNMMLLTNWSIRFTDANSCNHRQTVKWILYASGWIYRDLVKKNTKSRINESKRCTEWWLTIKWVLIWRWLQWVMDNSRSNLNNWFSATTKELKTKTIMNWASVIIEYSPSVFTKSSMPPGAEDFTTALSIYKQ